MGSINDPKDEFGCNDVVVYYSYIDFIFGEGKDWFVLVCKADIVYVLIG